MAKILDLSKFRTPGKILVLNHSTFDENYVESRVGTEKDLDALKRVFRDELKFTWEKADDLTVAQIRQKIQKYAAKDYSHVGALVIVILTHGRESGLLCAKDATYKLIDIFHPILESKTLQPLHNKLKWFIIQACRSGEFDKYEQRVNLAIDSSPARVPIYLSRVDEKLSTLHTISRTINTVISFSTAKGRVSTRSEENGSFMIQTLCNQLETSALEREPLLSMLCHVNRIVSSYTTHQEEDKTFAQTPSFMSSLRYDILFPKLSRVVACGSFPSTSTSQLTNPIAEEHSNTCSSQQKETSGIEANGKLTKKASVVKVEPYPMEKQYKYAGRAYILHDGVHKDLVVKIQTLARDKLKLTRVEKVVRYVSEAMIELKEVGLNNNFHQEASFFAFVVVDFNWPLFTHRFDDLIRAFFATSCTTLASKPKIFIFFDSKRRISVAPSRLRQLFVVREYGYANQHSDMLFVYGLSADFLSTLIETMISSRDYDLVSLITDVFVDTSEHLQFPEYFTSHVPDERTSTSDVLEDKDHSHIKMREVRVKDPKSSTVIESTLRFPFICNGNFENCIPFTEFNITNFVGLEFGIADPTTHFVGRLDELKQLANYLNLESSLVKERRRIQSTPHLQVEAGAFSVEDEEQDATNAEVVEEQASNVLSSNIAIDIAVTGVKGIGKSQIMLRFIEIYSKDFKNVFVIDTENIHVCFWALTQYTMTSNASEFYNYLKDKGNSLFIFENFNVSIDNISDYLPPSNVSNFSVIVVSQNVSFLNAKFELRVSSMCCVDAENLSRKLLRSVAQNDLHNLITKFGKHPLALEIVCNHYNECLEVAKEFPTENPQSFAAVIQNLVAWDELPTTVTSNYNGNRRIENIDWKFIKEIVMQLP